VELYFLDKNFQTICAPVDQAVSAVWSLRYGECGNFSVHFPLSLADTEGIQLLTLASSAVYLCDSTHCGRIETTICKTGKLEVGGKLLECLLYDRVAVQKRQYTGTVDQVILAAIGDWAADIPLETDPLMPSIGSENTIFMAAGENLGKWIHKLLANYGASYTIELNSLGQPVFSLIVGTDRSIDNADGTSPAIFNEAYGNIASLEMECYRQEMVNRVYVEGSDGTVVLVDISNGGPARETYKKAADISPTTYDSPEAYEDALREYGKYYLAMRGERRRFSCSVQWDASPVYGKDYRLGDVCEIQDEALSLQVAARLTAMDVVWEGGIQKLYPFFGDEIVRVSTMASLQ